MVDVIDPLAGLIAGVSEQDIDFQSAYDPARYTSGNANPAINPWGNNQVGRVWFNLSTVVFLDPFTDIIGASPTRDLAELTNRVSSWAQVAPGSSVDVYEWVKSTVSPITYSTNSSYPGTIYNVDNPSWVEELEYNPNTGISSTVYYFWVKGLTTIPGVDFRHTDVSTIALCIQNPSGLDLQWMAPINSDAIIVSGVQQFLNDVDTVMKVRLTINQDNPGRHSEWLLMRPTDSTSLPPDQFWIQLRSSLSGFNAILEPIPIPTLSPTRNTGINALQNMFVVSSSAGPRGGLMDARQAFVGSINNVFLATPIAIDRQVYINTIIRSTPIGPNLIWTQIDKSYPWEQPPGNEWDVEVYTFSQRNQLVARSDFLSAVTNNITIRVLLNSIGNPLGNQSWSIWNFNPVSAAAIIAANPLLSPAVALLQNANSVFDLATTYEHSVATDAARIALLSPLSINVGDRVLVTSSTDGFWAIWKYVGVVNSQTDAYGFMLWRVQTYRTSDFISYIDWYASGYSAANPPVLTYANAAARNITEGLNPTNLFVKISDDGTPNHYWAWTAYLNNEWVTVANQNGTISLNDSFYNPANLVHGINTAFPAINNIANNSTVLTFTNTTGIAPGQSVTGRYIQPGTNVVSVTNTTVTINKPISQNILAGELIYFNIPNLSDITNRDGSWELYILTQALRYGGLLLDSEINQIWFNIVNFCHVQQNDVNWVFKTSFMNIIGYGVPLAETPYVIPDQTSNLISYIDEVKPYHVKVREYSTQYNIPVDDANVTVTDFDDPLYLDPTTNTYRPLDPVADANILATPPWNYWFANYQTHLTPVRGLDLTILFDRYVADIVTWDTAPWDSTNWDDTETYNNTVYIHTSISKSLTTAGQTISVDDVRFLINQAPFTINLNGNSYTIGSVAYDSNNISTTTHGFSGTLTTTGANVSTADAVMGNIVEAVIVMQSAYNRITSYYAPTVGMAPNDPVLLMGLDYNQSNVVYPTTIDAVSGSSILTFSSISGVSVGQPVVGPNIIEGTYSIALTSTTVTLNQPIVGIIPAGTNITFELPIWIDGYILQTFEPPIGDFDMVGFDSEGFDTETDIYDTTYDGNSLTNPPISISINPPLTSRPGGFDLRAPYYTPGHPEERITFNGDDGLQIFVTAGADSGGPPQIIKSYNVSSLNTSTATLFFDMIPQANISVMVFRDGLRAIYNSDYTVDYFNRTVTVYITNVEIVDIHVFGFGGTSAISEQQFIGFVGNPIVLNNPTTLSNVAVVQAGDLLSGSAYSVSGNDVTITSVPTGGTDIAVVVYSGGNSTATTMNVQVFSYNLPQQWTIASPDTDTFPLYSGTIVEVDGKRLSPPQTWYGQFTLAQPWMFLPIAPIASTGVTVYVNDVLYGYNIPIVTSTSPSSLYPFHMYIPSPPPTNIAGQFVIFGNLMIALDPTFVSDNVVMVTLFAGDPGPDYTITSGLLTIYTAMDPSNTITVTTFSNAVTMGLQTVVYHLPLATNQQLFVPIPFAQDYALVSENGFALSPQVNYDIEIENIGWDTLNWDSNPFDIALNPVGVITDITSPYANPSTGYDIAAISTVYPTVMETSIGLANLPTSFNTMLFSVWVYLPDNDNGHGMWFSNQSNDIYPGTAGLQIGIFNDQTSSNQIVINAWDTTNSIIVSATFNLTTWTNWTLFMISIDTSTETLQVWYNNGGVDTALIAVTEVWHSRNAIAAPSSVPWHFAPVQLLTVAVDGTATNLAVAATTTISCVISTTKTNDYVLVFVDVSNASGHTASCSGAGLSFTKLLDSAGYANAHCWVFGAPSTTILTGETITVTFSSSIPDGVIAAVAFSGTVPSSPFDSNVSLPIITDFNGAATGSFTGISTNNPNDGLVWFMFGNDQLTTSPSGLGWEGIINYIQLGTEHTIQVSMLPLNTTITNQTYSPGSFTVPTDAAGMLALNGGNPAQSFLDAANLFFSNTTSFFDLTIESNRRKFVTSSAQAVNPNVDGSAILNATPPVFLSITTGQSASLFATNNGNGGAFNLTGSLSIAPSSPSGAVPYSFNPMHDDIVATIITTPAAREEMIWRVATNTPAFLRMPPALDASGHQIKAIPTNGSIVTPRPQYDINFGYVRHSPYSAGTLTQALGAADTQVYVTLLLENLSSKLWNTYPLAIPSGSTPGVIWIAGERIEYFGITQSGNNVVLTGLRRGTWGTSISEQRQVVTGTGTGSPQTFDLDASNGVGPLEIQIAQMPSSAFTSSLIGSVLQVVLTAPLGDFVTVAMTYGTSYPIGSPVYNGSETFLTPVPIGPAVGDREIDPMHKIIVG